MTLYKLTDRDGYTRYGEENACRWTEGVTHTAQREGLTLCTDQVIHAYEHPLIALFLNPLHADLSAPRLWEATGDIVVRDGPLKCGIKSLTIVRELPVPTVTLEHRVRFAILCAKAVYSDPMFIAWADAWLNRVDRSGAAARAAAGAAADLNRLAEQAVQA